MKLLIEIELDTDERMYYSELGRMVEKSLRLYHDAVAMGELPANEDRGLIHDTHGNQVGNWKATDDLPIVVEVRGDDPSVGTVDHDTSEELWECGRRLQECIAFENGDTFQHGDK